MMSSSSDNDETLEDAISRVQSEEPTFHRFLWIERNEINKRIYAHGIWCKEENDDLAGQNALCGAAQAEFEIAFNQFCDATAHDVGKHFDDDDWDICGCSGHVTLRAEHCCGHCDERDAAIEAEDASGASAGSPSGDEKIGGDQSVNELTEFFDGLRLAAKDGETVSDGPSRSFKNKKNNNDNTTKD